MRIVLACDQKWRDLPALVVVRQHLRKLGHQVVIVSTKSMESILPLVQPDCVVLNNFWDRRYHKLAKQLRECGIAVVVLPTEGATPTHLWGPMVFGEFSDYSLIDYQMCWNRPTADGIAAFGSMPSEKLDVVGCPRFDFAVEPLMQSCTTRDELCAMLGLDPARPIVTWASRFALAKMAYATPEARAAFDRQLDEIGYTQCVQRLGYTVRDLIDIYSVSLDKFLAAFIAAAKARPNIQFLFKPHPNDDVRFIETRIASAGPNAKLAVGIYIGDVLRGSDMLVNSDCNTSIEAWLHGVPVVDAQLHVDYVAGRPDIAAGNLTAHDQDEVIALIDRGLVDTSVAAELASVRTAFIERWFHKADGHRSETAARSLDRFLKTRMPRRKFFPLALGGGAKHVAMSGVAWMLDLPGGYPLRKAFRIQASDRMPGGTYDKVISRRDVTRMGRRLAPLIAA